MTKSRQAAVTHNKWIRIMSLFIKVVVGLSFVTQPVLARSDNENIWLDPVTGIEFVKIEAGCMELGLDEPKSIQLNAGLSRSFADEVPRHKVCLDTFWLGRFELTREQWYKFMSPKSGPVEFPLRPKLYIERVDAQQYLEKVNELLPDSEGKYRLPTEAEWEYSCRAGKAKIGNPDLDFDIEKINSMTTQAWFRDSQKVSDPHEQDVGQLTPNSWGLYDMLGNAMELVQDDYDEQGYRKHSLKNPLVNNGDHRYVLRGGSYRSQRWEVSCGVRNYGVTGDALPSVGMRVVKNIIKNAEF